MGRVATTITTGARSVRHRVRLPDAPPPDGVLLRVRDAAVTLGGERILDGVDLDVHGGELVALVGPNGAGKSTLLAVLAGDLEPDRGTVDLDGAALGSWTHVEMAMRRAVMLQQLTMSFPFTVRQTVEMGRSPWIGQDVGAAMGGARRSFEPQMDEATRTRRLSAWQAALRTL